MRILVATAGSHGDVLPFIALGKELSRRGHELYFYANPAFAGLVAEAGLRFRPVGTIEAYASLFSEVVDDNPRRAFTRVAREFATLNRQYYAAMQADLLAGQTAAVGGSLMFAPRLLAERAATPCATVHLAPCVIRSNRQPPRLGGPWIRASTPTPIKQLAWWLLDRFYDGAIDAPLNRQRAELGLPPVRRVFAGWIHQADCLIGMFPAWFAAPQDDWPPQLVQTGFPLYDHAEARPLSPELLHFLDAGPPPVGISAGTASANSHRFFRTSVDACQSAGLRAILLSPFAQHIPRPLPAGLIHVPYAPFGRLLPRLAAFVHHGGVGTTSQALCAGVPQLIRPVAYDQFDNSARAVALGVGLELQDRQYRTPAVAGALKSLAGNPAVRRRCAEVAQRFTGHDGVAQAAEAIEHSLRQKSR